MVDDVAGREPLDQLVKDIAGEVEKQGGWSGIPSRASRSG